MEALGNEDSVGNPPLSFAAATTDTCSGEHKSKNENKKLYILRGHRRIDCAKRRRSQDTAMKTDKGGRKRTIGKYNSPVPSYLFSLRSPLSNINVLA